MRGIFYAYQLLLLMYLTVVLNLDSSYKSRFKTTESMIPSTSATISQIESDHAVSRCPTGRPTVAGSPFPWGEEGIQLFVKVIIIDA